MGSTRAKLLLLVLPIGLALAPSIGCGAPEKPFAMMTAQEHRAAAARENHLADESFAKVSGANIEAPETLATGVIYGDVYQEHGGAVPYTYAPYNHDIDDVEADVAWPRVSDPSERDEDAASKHRELALRHERAAARLDGLPSPQPLPPPAEPLIPPDRG